MEHGIALMTMSRFTELVCKSFVLETLRLQDNAIYLVGTYLESVDNSHHLESAI